MCVLNCLLIRVHCIITRCRCWIWLPPLTQLNQAADALQHQLEQHDLPVLVCCALGYGRSAAVILTWWVRYGGANDLAHAVAQLQSARPQMVLPAATQHAILAALQQASHSSCHRPTS